MASEAAPEVVPSRLGFTQRDGGRSGKGVHAGSRARRGVGHLTNREAKWAGLDGSEHGEGNGDVVTVNGLSYHRTMKDYMGRTSHRIVANGQGTDKHSGRGGAGWDYGDGEAGELENGRACREKGMSRVPSNPSWNLYTAMIQLSWNIRTKDRDVSGRVGTRIQNPSPR